MRRWLVILLLVCTAACVEAQQMEVKDFTRLKRPLWNRSKVTVDKQKAIVDLTATEKGFSFTANGKEAAEVEEGDGVITVKVPHKSRYITIRHEQYGQLTWRVPAKYLKRKKHYRATLVVNDPTKVYKPQEQWVVMDIAPRNAIVVMDSTMTLVNDGQLTVCLPLGSHQWQVSAPFYEEQADSFLLTDSARVNLSVRLQPAYAYVTVSTPWQNGDIYVDGLYTAQGSGTSRRLQEGQHRLTVFRREMCIYDGTFTIGRAEKRTITLTDRDFEPQPIKKEKMLAAMSTQAPAEAPWVAIPQAPVILKAPDADTEIWVDRERMGKGQWSGQLAQGYHIVSTMKDSIESKPSDLWIVDSNPVQIDLAVPETSMATMNIHCNVTEADIYINNVRIGSTPDIVTQLPADRVYTVCLKKEGYKDAKATVRPKGNEMTDLKLKMKRKF